MKTMIGKKARFINYDDTIMDGTILDKFLVLDRDGIIDHYLVLLEEDDALVSVPCYSIFKLL